jgi:hypothetical protein
VPIADAFAQAGRAIASSAPDVSRSRTDMLVSMLANGHRIEVQTNTMFSPVETVRYDGKEVARGKSWLGSKYDFTVTEDGATARYEVEISLDIWYGGAKVAVRRNSELIFSVG